MAEISKKIAGTKGKFRKRYIVAAVVAALLIAALVACMPRIGSNPAGESMEKLSKASGYANGEFHNQIDTPMFAEGVTFASALMSGLFSSTPDARPSEALPVQKTDLKSLAAEQNALVWLGHSSYYLTLNGLKILVDPVLLDYAAPLPFFNRAFKGTAPWRHEGMPDTDYILITHDHYDHLEYDTIKALWPRTGKIICPLGVGSHLRSWGVPEEKIIEKDWYESLELAPDFSLYVWPARHFSGRWLARNKTLWAGYALISPDLKLYISGDSGYAPHFAEAGQKFAGFDLAILECGQYNPQWPYIHMFPEQTAQAGTDLQAAVVIPCHNGKFCLAPHAWYDPLHKIREYSKNREYRLVTPLIGEIIPLQKVKQ